MKPLPWHCVIFVFLLTLSLTAAGRGGSYISLTEPQRRTSAQSQTSYRLPANVVPTHYDVKLKPYIYEGPEADFFFEGWVTIYVSCLQATDVIILHKDRLNVSSSSISVKQVGNMAEQLYSHHSYDPVRHFLRLHLKRRLVAKQSYVVDIHRFSGPLRIDGDGLYLSYYMEGDHRVYLVASQLMAVFARKAFPCFDEPQLKATFNVTLVRRSDTGRNYMSLSNAPLINSDGTPWVEDRFERTPKMSTYLLAFVICDFPKREYYIPTSPPVKYRTFAPPAALPLARKIHDVGMKVFMEMSKHFRPKYSDALSKLDDVWLPHFFHGATESWGLITYDLKTLRGMGSPDQDLTLHCLVAHEIAHHWFGNLVTPKWWTWAWLNEGFTKWFAVYFTQRVFSHWNVTQYRLATEVFWAMQLDTSPVISHRLETVPTTPYEIVRNFDALSYYKSSALVRMMHLAMGTDTFFHSLKVFLARHQYSNVESSDLFDVLDETLSTKSCGAGWMSSRMPAWFTQPGLPLVTVNKTASGYRLTQTSLLPGTDYQWDIPIAYATSDGEEFNICQNKFWLRKKQTLDIQTAPYQWIVVNVNQMAYCRVLYDRATYNLLIGQLKRDHTVINGVSRGMVMNDATDFFKTNKLELSVVLRIVDYLKSELEYAPWFYFDRWFEKKARLLETSDLKKNFEPRIRMLVKEPVKKLSLTTTNTMPPTDILIREILAKWACRYSLKACVLEAKKVFSNWTHAPSSHAHLGPLYLCAAVAKGSKRDWQHVLTQYTTQGLPEKDRSILLRTLGCSTKRQQLQRFLNMCLDGTQGIPSSKTPQCVSAVAANRVGREVALNFLLQHSSQLKQSHADSIKSMLITVTRELHSAKFLDNQLPELKAKFNMSRLMRIVEWRARNNHRWMTSHDAALRAWLI